MIVGNPSSNAKTIKPLRARRSRVGESNRTACARNRLEFVPLRWRKLVGAFDDVLRAGHGGKTEVH
jgi:hypothetical protein